MDDIAPEYDVVVLGTGRIPHYEVPLHVSRADIIGLTECVLSGYAHP